MSHYKVFGVDLGVIILVGALFILLPFVGIAWRKWGEHIRSRVFGRVFGRIVRHRFMRWVLLIAVAILGFSWAVRRIHNWFEEAETSSLLSFWVTISIIVLVPILWHVTQWKKVHIKIQPGQRGMLTVFGRNTGTILGQGDQYIFFPGVFGVNIIDMTITPLKITVSDIWTNNTSDEVFMEHMRQQGISPGRARLKARLEIAYQVVDIPKFQMIRNLVELVRPLCEHELRAAAIDMTIRECLSKDGQAGIHGAVQDGIIGGCGDWGIRVSRVLLTELDFADPEVAAAAQLLYRELQERAGEVAESGTIVLQAKTTLEGQGWTPTDEGYRRRLEEEVDRIRRQRINETGAKSGKAVILPTGFSLFGRPGRGGEGDE